MMRIGLLIFFNVNNVTKYIWTDGIIANNLLEKGLVFKTKEEAVKACNKILIALKEEN